MAARTVTILHAVVAAVICHYGPLGAQPAVPNAAFQNETVSASLVADTDSIVPGRQFRLGVRLIIESSWHVNWINPGDAGLAPSVQWVLPEGFTGGVLQWPCPAKYPVGPLTIFGYDGEVVLFSLVTPPADLTPGATVKLRANVSWLACQEACIPGDAQVELTLPVSADAPPSAEDAIARSRTRVPVPPAEWEMEGWYQDDFTIVLQMQSSSGTAPVLDGVYFFPYEQGIIENSEPQKLTMTSLSGAEGGYRLEIPRSRMVRAAPERLAGVIVSSTGWSKDTATPALAVDIPLSPYPR